MRGAEDDNATLQLPGLAAVKLLTESVGSCTDIDGVGKPVISHDKRHIPSADIPDGESGATGGSDGIVVRRVFPLDRRRSLPGRYVIGQFPGHRHLILGRFAEGDADSIPDTFGQQCPDSDGRLYASVLAVSGLGNPIARTRRRTVSTIITVLDALIEITMSLKSWATATRRNSMALSTIPAGVSP